MFENLEDEAYYWVKREDSEEWEIAKFWSSEFSECASCFWFCGDEHAYTTEISHVNPNKIVNADVE